MDKSISGIHHVTMICGDPQQNLDFYVGLLGLRFVKRTVNFDDPGAYHLYYGDSLGTPGTLLTFFAWPHGKQGRQGAGQASAIALSVPSESLGYWTHRLIANGIECEKPANRFGEQVLSFHDPDGLPLELVQSSTLDERVPWAGGAVPQEYAIRGVHSVTLLETDAKGTDALLRTTMNFERLAEEGNRTRYGVGEAQAGCLVDVVEGAGFWNGMVALGTVHHVAWRTPDDNQQERWRAELVKRGYDVTPVRDREYFHSIYYREPGGVLFEIATDAPGFTVDETADELGEHLKLPPWLENRRSDIERALPPLQSSRIGHLIGQVDDTN